jgi:AcrR family transcriptional regulator
MAVALPQRPTQAERRSRSEEALLDAAAELIGERGVGGTSLASIGERAGVSRGLPTHHFGTKDVLVARLAKRAQDRIEAAMAEAAQHRHGRDVAQLTGLEIIELSADSYLELFADPSADQRALLVMWGSTFASRADVDGMVEAERRSYDGLAGVVAAGQRDQSIRTDIDPVAAAVLILGIIRGTAALLLTDAAIVEIGSVRETCHRLIESGLADDGDRRP